MSWLWHGFNLNREMESQAVLLYLALSGLLAQEVGSNNQACTESKGKCE